VLYRQTQAIEYSKLLAGGGRVSIGLDLYTSRVEDENAPQVYALSTP
jgi:hypothetical protein